MYECSVWCLQRSEEAIRPPGPRFTHCCETQCGCWEPRPLLEQLVLLSSEPASSPTSSSVPVCPSLFSVLSSLSLLMYGYILVLSLLKCSLRFLVAQCLSLLLENSWPFCVLNFCSAGSKIFTYAGQVL